MGLFAPLIPPQTSSHQEIVQEIVIDIISAKVQLNIIIKKYYAR